MVFSDRCFMKNMIVNLSPRRHSKIWDMYMRLLRLYSEGKGEETMMICFPNAPFHYETKQSLWELDGIPQVHYYQEKTYDYPKKTINTWINLYHKQGYFVK